MIISGNDWFREQQQPIKNRSQSKKYKNKIKINLYKKGNKIDKNTSNASRDVTLPQLDPAPQMEFRSNFRIQLHVVFTEMKDKKVGGGKSDCSNHK